jgi:uncharacterized protein YodC (DUF2158 family)
MSQSEFFEVGDVVCLNSGSPPMTIVSLSHDKSLVLAYADMNGSILRECLPPEAVALTEMRWSISSIDAQVDMELDEDEDDEDDD